MPRRDEGYFASKDGTRLFWRQEVSDAEPKAWLGVIHGYGDHLGRYARPIEHFAHQGLGVLAFDYRGHGKADGSRGDVKAWPDYLDDLQAFWLRLVDAARGKPIFLLGHSHGGLMLTHWLARGAPRELTGVILSSPFYAFAFEPPRLQVFGARLIKGILPGLKISNGLKADQLSRDPAWQQETNQDPLYLHDTTPRWFFSVLEAQAGLSGVGAKISTPVLLVGGQADPIAAWPAQDALVRSFASPDKTVKGYPDFRHEVLMEVGREQVWADISSWISAHL